MRLSGEGHGEPDVRDRLGRERGRQRGAEEPAESREDRIERLARLAKDLGPSAGQDGIFYPRSARPGQQIHATVYLHTQALGTGETIWWTADVDGTLIESDDVSGFQMTAGTELVSADGHVSPAGRWTRGNPLRFAP